MTITLDRQIELAETLLMGPGTPYAIESQNVFTFPDLATGDIGIPQRHGLWSGRDLLRGRRIPIAANCIGATKQAAIDAMETLVGAWQPVQEDVTLDVRSGARTYRMFGRPRLADPNPRFIAQGVIRVELRFLATDPLRYAINEVSASSSFPVATDFYDEEYGGYLDPLTNGRLLHTNAGNIGAPWRMTIEGPWVDPKIQLFDPDPTYPPILHEIEFDTTLADGEVLEIDTRLETVTVDGDPSLVLAAMVDDWFTIPPGDWALRATGVSGSGAAEAWMRSAWL